MNNAITFETNAEQITLVAACSNGNRMTYNESKDRRIVEVIDGKVWCRSAKAAYEIAGEMQAMGLSEARADGVAVVFWS
jgi:uncharacterized protein YbaR (Trm112 family)